MTQLREQPNQTRVDGVPVVWADGPDPFTGALLFRVGRADETLSTSGLTHLVEHLALFPIGRQPYEYNGRVEENVTIFYASGRREEVLDFLGRCARHVADLPLDRLEDEKRVLRIEAAAGGGLYSQLLSYRYGASGYGLMAFQELGLRWLEAQHVAEWAARYFTRGNAVAWLTGPPDGLSLPLPDGRRHESPEPEPIERLELPAQSWHRESAVALTFEGARSAALRVGFATAADRVHQQLRIEEGVTYSPGGAYHPLTSDRVHLMLSTDCAERAAAPVLEGLLRIVDDLAENGPSGDELEWDRSMMLRTFEDPRAQPGHLDSMARRELIGGAPVDDATLLREHEALTPEEAATAIRDAIATMLVSAPFGTPKSTREGLRDYDVDLTSPIDGVSFPPRETWKPLGVQGELIVGTEGFTFRQAPGGDVLSIRFEECVAAVQCQDSSLSLISNAGTTLLVDPQQFEDGSVALDTIRDRLPEGIVVPMDELGQKVDAVAREKLSGERQTPIVGDLEALVSVLSPEEELVNLAEARRTRYRGLLATTDRRLIFVFDGTTETDFREVPFDDIRVLKVKGLRNKRLCVTVEGEHLEFSEIWPRERLKEIEGQLTGA